MDEKNTDYRIPVGFNPWLTLDSIRGLADALHQFMTEGPGTKDTFSYGDRCSLDGLIELTRREAHTLHDYFIAIGEFTTLKLPLADSDFESLHVKHARTDEVREEPALYLVRYNHQP